MIKLVVMDLDGTCLVPDPIIGLGGKEEHFPKSLIKCSKKINIPFTLATGRTFSGLSVLLSRENPLHSRTPIITDNGSRMAKHCGELHWEKKLSEAEIAATLESFDSQRKGSDAILFFPHKAEGVFFSRSKKTLKICRHYVKQYLKDFKEFSASALTQEPAQIIIRGTERSFRFPEHLNHSGNGGNNGKHTCHWQNIQPTGINKAESIKRLLELTGILPEEMIFAGDDTNDRVVFRDPVLAPAKKIVVGSKLREESADIRIDSPHQLAEAIYKIV
jgi:HAD superfamily hydrolase (TIGR01484 family)